MKDDYLQDLIKSLSEQQSQVYPTGKAFWFPLIIMGLVFTIVSIALNGLTIMLLWNWFLVPIGVKSIGFVLALGISLLSKTLIKISPVENKEKDLYKLGGKLFGESVLIPSLTILFGYILVCLL